jgi:hypothetical protein
MTVLWQPVADAPGGMRVLVCDPAGLVTIARRIGASWLDDADRRLIMEPHGWMELPQPRQAPEDGPIFLV